MKERNSKKGINVLFVCKHNIFRSRVAEALAKKVVAKKNKKFNISSGGLFAPGGVTSALQKKVFHRWNLELSEPEPISFTKLCNTDVVIIVADDIPPSLFKDFDRYGEKKVISWHISDIKEKCYSERDIEEVMEKIKKRVESMRYELL